MRVADRSYRCFRLVLLIVCSLILHGGVEDCRAVDLGTPVLSEPLQTEKFFAPDRLTVKGEARSTSGGWEPQVGISHSAREDDVSSTGKQTIHRIHGEAGGKLNILENLSLTAIARIPLYTHETRFEDSAFPADGKVSSDLLRNTGNLSWRSEVGVNLGAGVDINLFYDQSMFGRDVKPGVDDRDEKFGTRVIIHFK